MRWRIRLALLAIVGALSMASLDASAGSSTNISWSLLPGGNGGACQKVDLGRPCYYNFTAATDSPILAVSGACGQLFTRVIETVPDIVIDLQACDANGSVSCTDLPFATNLSASGSGPYGGIALGIKVNVDVCKGCDGEVEVICGGVCGN